MPEPAPKRKTLAERAGEPINPPRSHMLPPPPLSKPVLSRSESTTAQVGTRPPSSTTSNGHYRNASLASTTSSIGSIRASSRQNGMHPVGGMRPPSASGTYTTVEEELESGGIGKRKGTATPSFAPQSGITLRKTRQQHSSAESSDAWFQHLGSVTQSSSRSSRANSGEAAGQMP